VPNFEKITEDLLVTTKTQFHVNIFNLS